jgi:hypothetical protein
LRRPAAQSEALIALQTHLRRQMAKWKAGPRKFWRAEDPQDLGLRETGIKSLFVRLRRIARHHGKQIISIVH